MMVMKKSFEFEGSSVEDAVIQAMTKLKVSREAIIFKVVSEEQKGLFGMQGAKPAKIIVKIKDKKV